jgi:hypothetical protein
MYSEAHTTLLGLYVPLSLSLSFSLSASLCLSLSLSGGLYCEMASATSWMSTIQLREWQGLYKAYRYRVTCGARVSFAPSF